MHEMPRNIYFKYVLVDICVFGCFQSSLKTKAIYSSSVILLFEYQHSLSENNLF